MGFWTFEVSSKTHGAQVVVHYAGRASADEYKYPQLVAGTLMPEVGSVLLQGPERFFFLEGFSSKRDHETILFRNDSDPSITHA